MFKDYSPKNKEFISLPAVSFWEELPYEYKNSPRTAFAFGSQK